MGDAGWCSYRWEKSIINKSIAMSQQYIYFYIPFNEIGANVFVNNEMTSSVQLVDLKTSKIRKYYI